VTPDQPQGKKRSRKIYVLWGVGLTLLLTAAAFCWAVVVPVWQVHRAADWDLIVASTPNSAGRCRITNFYLALNAARRLGSAEHAGRAMNLYLRVPESLASRKDRVKLMLAANEPETEKRMFTALVTRLESEDAYTRTCALQSLAEMCKHGFSDAMRYIVAATEDRNRDVAYRAIVLAEEISGQRFVSIAKPLVERTDLAIRAYRRNVLDWWNREGKAKYGRGEE